jgi:hypothetical protein
MSALRIVSGGQTGVDRAALEWALANGVSHGGWCPKGRKAEDGIIPARFGLLETDSENYAIRTRRNVQEADGTVIFSRHLLLTGGTKFTADVAGEVAKPLLRLIPSIGIEEAAARLRTFLREHDVRVLNVAGPRASEEPALGTFVQAVLARALEFPRP